MIYGLNYWRKKTMTKRCSPDCGNVWCNPPKPEDRHTQWYRNLWEHYRDRVLSGDLCEVWWKEKDFHGAFQDLPRRGAGPGWAHCRKLGYGEPYVLGGCGLVSYSDSDQCPNCGADYPYVKYAQECAARDASAD